MLHKATVNKIASQLDELGDDNLLSIYRGAMAYDGSFDFVDTFDFEDLAEMTDSYEFGRSIVYGNVTNVSDPVRYNGYGNLESVSEFDLASEARDQLDELADWLINNNVRYVTCDLGFYGADGIVHTLEVYERTFEPEAEVCDAIAAMFA